MKTVIRSAKRAISLIELVVVLVLTSIAMTASFAVISGLAGGDQTVFTSAEQSAEAIENDLKQDLKSAHRCPSTGETAVVNVAGTQVSFPVLEDSGVMRVVTWQFSNSTESLTRTVSTSSGDDCSPGATLEAISVSSRVASASFAAPTSDSVELVAQLRSGSNGLYGMTVFASR